MQKSAGILLYRKKGNNPEVFLVHPGGPFWKNKDAWSIPKGEFTEEDPLVAAKREFEEETGSRIEGAFKELLPVKQKSGKLIYAWAVEGEFDPSAIVSNVFPLEWPPKSGKYQNFPEVDRAGWFSLEEARVKLLPAQVPLLEQLVHLLS
jgi:predicted NUDIX family NTP pyrophosphohydrolase